MKTSNARGSYLLTLRSRTAGTSARRRKLGSPMSLSKWLSEPKHHFQEALSCNKVKEQYQDYE